MQNRILDAALSYHDQGLSIIPIGKDKKPLIAWKKYQTELATRQQILAWFAQKNVNIGLVTGTISGVVVMDFDIKHGRKSSEFQIEPTVCSKTGGGGEHMFFKHPRYEVPSTNGVLFGVGIDIKADGGYVVLPPSLHLSGNEYEWLIPFNKLDLAEMPDWFVHKVKENQSIHSKTDWETLSRSSIPEGQRHDMLTKIIGKFLHDLSPNLWEEMGWPAIQEWNATHSKPPTQLKELRAIWDGLKKKELSKTEDSKGKENRSVTQQIIDAIENDPGTELFHDQHNEPYIKILNKDHYDIWSCKSKKLDNLISMKFWDLNQKPVGSEVMKNVLGILQAKACFQGKEYQLNNRVAWKNNELWYDLTNEPGQAVRVSKDGWAVISDTPILFRKHNHQVAQVMPALGGGVRELLKYININNKHHELLLMVFVVTCFIPDIAHVIPIIYGAQGSAKSTLSKLLRKICDPSQLEVISIPRYQDMPQTLSHHWFLFFDNVSYISEEMSDLLAKVVTGSGFTKRELYTNDEDVIYSFKRVVGINGINLVAMRPDLLERSILLELERIPEDRRKQEKEVLNEFENALPGILGGVFDVLVKAMQIQPEVKLEKLPRMADFAVWGYAIAEAMGYGGDAFLEAYKANMEAQSEEVLSQDPVGTATMIMMENCDHWEDTPSALYKKLCEIASFNLGMNLERDPSWPKAVNQLSKRMNMLEVIFASQGIKFQKMATNGQRMIILDKF
ncbi:hypothetical protein BH11PAT2_BH11PAT2_04930 [soil metagenome]